MFILLLVSVVLWKIYSHLKLGLVPTRNSYMQVLLILQFFF